MNKTTKDLKLPTTITGSLPRPEWYTENLGARPFRDALADARYREQYTDAVGTYIRDQERAGLDIVTDGDARFDHDVGGMSWLQYPARRFKGLEGGDYYRARKGYGGATKGDIIFEVMESRVMPRCVGKIERGPLQYAALWRTAQQLTARPVKFGTATPELIGTSVGNDHYAKPQELLQDISDAMREELIGARARGLPDRAARGAEHSLDQHPARRRRAVQRRVLRRRVQQHRERPARSHRGLVPHVLGQPGAAAAVRDESVVPRRAAASQQARRRRDHVRVLHERRHGPRGDRPNRSPTRRSRSASSIIATCKSSGPSKWPT